jgi:urease accessory protein
MASPTSPGPTLHQRADGRAELRFERAGERIVLRHLYQSAPLRVLFPRPEAGEPLLAALVNTAGGLAGGDRLRVAVVATPGSIATLCTPAAEKLYRSLGPETRVETTLRVEAGASLEWLPQETILFNEARLRRWLEIDLASDARLLAAEMLVFGRTARGESFDRGSLHDSWRLRVDGKLRWADALRLEEPGPALADRFGFCGAGAFATLLYAGTDAAARLAPMREAAGPLGAATIPREGVALIRWLGPAAAVRAALAAAIPALRPVLLGLPPFLPRLWTT